MTLVTTGQLPISVKGTDKRDVRTQFAALCYRMNRDKPEVLMIKTRGTGRWLIPKGWPMHGKTPAECALIEAWEEAGVKGKVFDHSLGIFSYFKQFGPDRGAHCVAMVFPVKVKSLAKSFPEAGQRRRKWMSAKKAAKKVSEPELAQILRTFNPHLLGRSKPPSA